LIPARGSVVHIDLNPIVGHEQGGMRPAIVVSPGELANAQRYPIVVVVPLTSKTGLSELYPVVQPYTRGLNKPSTVLVDQIRAIDKQRIRSVVAPLPALEMRRVDEALRKALGL